jgi:transcriptional regulator with XRE-family HTH domain
MEAKGLDDAAVAKEIGVDRSTVSRLRRRETRPNWKTLRALREFSGGSITADAFDEIEAA